MKQSALCSFQLALTLPFTLYKTKEEIDIEEDVILLESLTIHRLSKFSAAGFFHVDFSTIFSMLGCVSAFVLVAVPFGRNSRFRPED